MANKNPTKDYYERNAAIWTDYKNLPFWHEKSVTKFFSHLEKGSAILDIGCAGGTHVPLFLGLGRHLKYHGIDITNAFLKVAARRFPQLTFTHGDMLDATSLPQKKFGGFIAINVLMHAPKDKLQVVFQNIQTIMKPAAFGFFTLPLTHPGGDTQANDPREFTVLTETEQRVQIKQAGWKIIGTGTIDRMSVKKCWGWYIVQLPHTK